MYYEGKTLIISRSFLVHFFLFVSFFSSWWDLGFMDKLDTLQ